MFYVKDKDGNHLTLGADGTPVYDTCPECGIEHEIHDFWEWLDDDDIEFHMYDSSVCCHECSQRISEQRKKGPRTLRLHRPDECEF